MAYTSPYPNDQRATLMADKTGIAIIGCGMISEFQGKAIGDLPDAFVVGFEHRDDAERFLVDLRGRFAEFNLELAEEKTRLIEFGRFAAPNREARGLPKPETFDFLGFTHACGKTRKTGRFALARVTS